MGASLGFLIIFDISFHDVIALPVKLCPAFIYHFQVGHFPNPREDNNLKNIGLIS